MIPVITQCVRYKQNMSKLKVNLSKSIVLLLIFSSIFLLTSLGIEEDVSVGHAAETEVFWLFKFLGRLHPLIVHFPVSLIVIAAFMEMLSLKNYNSNLRAGIQLLLIIGAVSAVLSVIFGLLIANLENYSGDTLALHQWIGIGTALLSCISLLFVRAIKKEQKRSLIIAYRTILIVTVFGIAITGHLGASITHGTDFLSSVTPWADNNEDGATLATSDIDLATFAKNADSLTIEEQVKLNIGVRTILAHNCYKCHSSDKMEGELRLDDKALLFKGGESGPVITPGNLHNSELFRRIALPASHKDAMPGKGKSLSKKDIELLAFWIDKGAPWPDQAAAGIFSKAPLAPRKPTLPAVTKALNNPIDLFANEYFTENKIDWKKTVDDRTYLRRVYLDIIGLLPTPEKTDEFVNDKRTDKRALLVNELLGDDHQYATHWFTFWNDLLRNDYTGTGYITNGRFSISDWLYKSLASNKPYKQMVQELLNPNEASKGFVAGIQWRGDINSSQTVPMQAAQNVSQALLGLNLKCASCHDSFISDWKLNDAYSFANAFSEEPLEVNRCDIPTGKFVDPKLLWDELGAISKKASKKEKAQQMAESLTKDENGRLYRTIVNRIWAQLMGRGIVAPTDEMDNKPWSQDLLDWLAVDFVENGYDMKKLIRLIVDSKVYQLPAVTIDDAATINATDFQFTGILRRKMTAEQFADAVSNTISPIYGLDRLKYNPYEAFQLQPNQAYFARASLVENDDFLTAMGRPNRDNVISVRESQSNLLQAMELTNGSKLNETLRKGAQSWLKQYNNSEQIVTQVYRRTLGRNPSKKELDIAKNMFADKPDENSVQDFLWAVILLPEFQLIN